MTHSGDQIDLAASRRRYVLQGQVQGVGFRPFIYGVAIECALSGFVHNTPEGVVVEVQGPESSLDAFSRALDTRLPPLAYITHSLVEKIQTVQGDKEFVISQTVLSEPGKGHAVLISPDMSLCADCLAELSNPADRRYLYPFINCTNCGPRYTITKSMPYDRSETSMACFPMCPHCLREYEDPGNRRFHAQPNACPVCGPTVWFRERISSETQEGDVSLYAPLPDDDPAEAVKSAARLLKEGGILALKGLGGFHLACTALDASVVERLRMLKKRPHKPFAVMVRDIAAAKRIAHIGVEERNLLQSPEHPIVLCRLLDQSPLTAGCSPDTRMVGIMLPYTPLHETLFTEYAALGAGYVPDSVSNKNEYTTGQGEVLPLVLVMTSGNPGGEPICLGNREAVMGLSGMADGFLFHNRDILVRVDDSVVRPTSSGITFFRRARGYVPRPVPLGTRFSQSFDVPLDLHTSLQKKGNNQFNDALSIDFRTPSFDEITDRVILGVGAELKNTFSLLKRGEAFVSQHIGDMSNMETGAFHKEMVSHLAQLLQVRPNLVVRDMHPDFLSSIYAEESGLPVVSLQHHYAHAHAILAEHRYLEEQDFPPVLVLALDGTGLGEDGTLWGGELLYIRVKDGLEHARLGHLAPMLLPGGDAAVKEPWRIAHAMLVRLGLLECTSQSLPWFPEQQNASRLLPVMMERRINTPQSTSCGRLFDAVSALLGLCTVASYEGQAAILLEEAQYGSEEYFSSNYVYEALYPCPVRVAEQSKGCAVLDTDALFQAVWEDWHSGKSPSHISRMFHASLACGLANLAACVAKETGVRHVGLSGGCFQNETLSRLLSGELHKKGLIPLQHTHLPPNDACISLGQAAWGYLYMQEKQR